MASCCHAHEYSSLFGGVEATVRAWLFRWFGVRGSARVAAGFAGDAGGADATLLEVGGGLGEVQVVLLQAGRAARATNVELSSGWERRAVALLAEHGLRSRVDRRLGDVVDDVDDLAPADLVVAHRVLCCYPHWRRMADALAALTRRRLVITLPVDRRRARAALGVANTLLALRGVTFRVYVHPVDALLDRLAERGLAVVDDDVGLVWRTVALAPATT